MNFPCSFQNRYSFSEQNSLHIMLSLAARADFGVRQSRARIFVFYFLPLACLALHARCSRTPKSACCAGLDQRLKIHLFLPYIPMSFIYIIQCIVYYSGKLWIAIL